MCNLSQLKRESICTTSLLAREVFVITFSVIGSPLRTAKVLPQIEGGTEHGIQVQMTSGSES